MIGLAVMIHGMGDEDVVVVGGGAKKADILGETKL